jgi:hypothetical protein
MAHGQGVETDGLGRILHNGTWRHDEPLAAAGSSTIPVKTTMTSAASTVKTLFDGFPKLPTMFSTTKESAPVAPPPFVVEHEPDPPTTDDSDANLEPVVNRLLVDARGRRGNFRGMVLRGVPHGVGHMEYESSSNNKEMKGDTYQGFWDYGDWKEGRVEYQNGDVYHGDFGKLNVRSGNGQYLWADGRQYQGEWQNDARHGQGQFHYPNGDYFHGTFSHGMRHGHGRFEFHDGSLFEGGFQKGEFHGQGCKYVHRDGRVYLGDFMDGVRNGYGKETYPSGSLRYEGEWVNDDALQSTKVQPAPPGFILQDDVDDEMASLASEVSKTPSIVTDTKDCTTVVEESIKDAQGNPGTFTGLVLRGLPHGVGRMVYTGEIREGFWKNGYLEGHARAFFANGDFYEGMFFKSQRQGKGVYKWKDGRIYEGDYIDDQRHGSGRFVYPSGDEYVGDYDLGMRSGMGKFTFADGSNYEGGWYDSLYHGYGELKEVTGNYYKGEWKEGKKHGTGQQYNEKERLLQKGEWEDDNFVKEDESVVGGDENASLGEDSERTATDLVESPRTRKQSFRWGSFDGENRRWEPLEAVDMIQEQPAGTREPQQQPDEEEKEVVDPVVAVEKETKQTDQVGTLTAEEEDLSEKIDGTDQDDTVATIEQEEEPMDKVDEGTSDEAPELGQDSLPIEEDATNAALKRQPSKDDGDWLKVNESSEVP